MSMKLNLTIGIIPLEAPLPSYGLKPPLPYTAYTACLICIPGEKSLEIKNTGALSYLSLSN